MMFDVTVEEVWRGEDLYFDWRCVVHPAPIESEFCFPIVVIGSVWADDRAAARVIAQREYFCGEPT